MTENLNSFERALEEDHRTRARFDAVADKMQSEARELLGCELTIDEVKQLSAARLAVLTDEPLSTFRWLDEARELEGVKARARDAELRRQIEAGDEEAVADMARLSPAQRMSKARELGLDGSTKEARKPTSVADEATLLRQILTLRPSERLARARSLGLA